MRKRIKGWDYYSPESEWDWTNVRGRLIVEKESKKEKKEAGRERRNEEAGPVGELDNLTLRPKQTWGMGSSLEVKRLGDNDADDSRK